MDQSRDKCPNPFKIRRNYLYEELGNYGVNESV